MRHRKAVSIAIAAVFGALAVAAVPALAGAKDDHGNHGGERHHHHHGVFNRDDDTGTISAFDATSRKLTITLTDGESFSGLVTSRTRIRCEGFDDRGARFPRDGGNSGSGSSSSSGDDNSGSGSGDDNGRGVPEPGDDHGEALEPGDDNGGRGFEPGDDRGDHGNGRICSTADLTVGAVVREAELELEHGIARFDEVELAHTS